MAAESISIMINPTNWKYGTKAEFGYEVVDEEESIFKNSKLCYKSAHEMIININFCYEK